MMRVCIIVVALPPDSQHCALDAFGNIEHSDVTSLAFLKAADEAIDSAADSKVDDLQVRKMSRSRSKASHLCSN